MKTAEEIIAGAQLLKKLNPIERDVIIDWMKEYANQFKREIKMPSDVEEKAKEIFPEKLFLLTSSRSWGDINTRFRSIWEEGANWMKEQIIELNK